MDFRKEKYKKCDVLTKDIINHINKHKKIYLESNTGLGKTHMFCYLANHYDKVPQKNTLIYSMTEIIQIDRDRLERAKTGDVRKPIVQELQDCDYLFIDDLGNERFTQYTIADLLVNILDYRYREEKPTFVSSNYSLGELFKRYEPKVGHHQASQITSRLQSFGVFKLQGKSLRKKYDLEEK